ncbi:hypothetical protein pEaSNUABM50_00548 [Erwinia phage pEa_SNUABM_50]|uniref:Uncharacterized protein n=4 Tax=Eneladusvirus BF TaxID=2560751 RepID=A0A7L8ZP22_9CAUD|nr:hypothetical protein FDH34_gp396 [Serratia phage BF]QOI71425.1 hypothetical protein pEaSNUABM12_00508 [Erwinia phage pEa_SNUABM_12]QOI71998.1 hypothetical protein pEaSNUABM47_00549 [Erwinia phage pEa_SNUABM_47]QOI72538.1 hypothetical protein pEaSNUABM50_00548 [Erwinia phage pEa_SNUABM_50]QXO11670.1 hypothetical protein pEaSNUABM19_00559 [Erwinia phage pEa_SNUABM_19]QXO12219.1 hypothetical protein pEaSNUABM44_00558 [Erwinia phage pEa_SNUABM_44]QXO12773.1 hypothetical protein pEaSNUABM49_005
MTFDIFMVMVIIFVPSIFCLVRYPNEIVKIFVLNFVLGYLWVMHPPVYGWLNGAFHFLAWIGWFMLLDTDNNLKKESK